MESVTHAFRGAAYRHLGGELVAVDDVSLALASDPPQIVTLVGESGSGKSTVARILLGLLKPARGRVTFDGDDVYSLSARERSSFRRAVQAVFQDPYGIFNPFYRADRVLWKAIERFGIARTRAEALEVIERSLAAVQLQSTDVLGRYPHQLSGGQRQRVMLARAHLLQPAFIVADEPVSMLDAAVRVHFLNILRDFRLQYGMSTLFITHDLSNAFYVGGHLLVMSRGRIVERGDADAVMLRPAHPYTQLLLASLPSPDPDIRWSDRMTDTEQTSAKVDGGRQRCLFAERCPRVMDRCWSEVPPSYPVPAAPPDYSGNDVSNGRPVATGVVPADEEGHAVACFLYDPSTLAVRAPTVIP
jgi:oligopeptide/dipeptide ABC transporter ATP-binding protein